MVNRLFCGLVVALCCLVAACDRDYQNDNTPIAKDNFAMIQLESDICKQSAFEADCLKHLKARIQ